MDVYVRPDGYYTGRALLNKGLIVCHNCGDINMRTRVLEDDPKCPGCNERLMFVREEYAEGPAIKSTTIRAAIKNARTYGNQRSKTKRVSGAVASK